MKFFKIIKYLVIHLSNLAGKNLIQKDIVKKKKKITYLWPKCYAKF